MSVARRSILTVLVVALVLGSAAAPLGAADMQGSLSIIAMDRASGAIGIAVVSDAPACGADVPWVEAGVGAVATQGDVNPGWGPRGLALLRAGIPPKAVCDSLYMSDPAYPRRQVGVIDRNGNTGGYSGIELIGFAAGAIDSLLAVQGNSLSWTTALLAVHDTMVAQAGLPLPERLLHGLAWGATQARGPLRSATLLVGRVDPERPEYATRWISLRVDDHRNPVVELRRLFRAHAAARMVESHLHFAERAKKDGARALEKAERARAEELMNRALADTTLPAHALNAMAWGLARHDVHLDRAAQAVDRILVLEPKNRSFLDTASLIAEKRGDRKAALDYAKRATAVATRDEYLHERVKALEPTAGK